MTDNEVRLAPGLPPIPERLLLARDRGEVLFITGAGISRPAPSSLPDFRELVVEVYRRIDLALAGRLDKLAAAEISLRSAGGTVNTYWHDYADGLNSDQQAELRSFVSREFDVVLGLLERRHDKISDGANSVRRAVDQILSSKNAPNELHRALVRVGQRFGRPFLATTNFDKLLTVAATRQRLSPKVYSLGAMPRPSRRRQFEGIFHLHGQLPQAGAATDFVLTDQDFGDVYLRRKIAADFIYDASRIFNLVLVGYSLSDAPMRYLMNAIAGDEAHYAAIKPRYAIIPTSEHGAVDVAYWKGRGIHPIPYDASNDHEGLVRLMSEWAKSIPSATNSDWARRKIRQVTRTSREMATSDERALFHYIFRRASPSERVEYVNAFSGKGASAGWLTAANDVIREDVGGSQ